MNVTYNLFEMSNMIDLIILAFKKNNLSIYAFQNYFQMNNKKK